MRPVIYELDPVNMEADNTYFFCSEACRDKFTQAKEPTIFGDSAEWIEGAVCDQCERPLEEVA